MTMRYFKHEPFPNDDYTFNCEYSLSHMDIQAGKTYPFNFAKLRHDYFREQIPRLNEDGTIFTNDYTASSGYTPYLYKILQEFTKEEYEEEKTKLKCLRELIS